MHRGLLKLAAACLVAAPALILLSGCPMMDTFSFDNAAPSAYTRVDRMGMPAVSTALISTANKDAYNRAQPTDDADGDFLNDIVASVTAFHAALDDDLTAAGLTPATVQQSLDQAGPVVVPDTIKIDTTQAAGFPNGRRLTDPVVDVTLAVALLDLTVHSPTVLAELPLNPAANDKAFSSAFPYLASPHQP